MGDTYPKESSAPAPKSWPEESREDPDRVAARKLNTTLDTIGNKFLKGLEKIKDKINKDKVDARLKNSNPDPPQRYWI